MNPVVHCDCGYSSAVPAHLDGVHCGGCKRFYTRAEAIRRAQYAPRPGDTALEAGARYLGITRMTEPIGSMPSVASLSAEMTALEKKLQAQHDKLFFGASHAAVPTDGYYGPVSSSGQALRAYQGLEEAELAKRTEATADTVPGEVHRLAQKRIAELQAAIKDTNASYDEVRLRCAKFLDEAERRETLYGLVRNERDDLLRENAVLRRKLEAAERKGGKR